MTLMVLESSGPAMGMSTNGFALGGADGATAPERSGSRGARTAGRNSSRRRRSRLRGGARPNPGTSASAPRALAGSPADRPGARQRIGGCRGGRQARASITGRRGGCARGRLGGTRAPAPAPAGGWQVARTAAGSAAPERQRLPAAANAGGDGNSALRRPWPVRRGAAPQHICCI